MTPIVTAETCIREIPLTQGHVAIVDAEDYDFLMQWKWTYHPAHYAVRSDYITPTHSKRVYMHRIIVGCSGCERVDHINRNGLDNRRCNLRLASHQQNQWNKGPISTNTSGYKGVSRHRSNPAWTPKWSAQLNVNKRKIYLGCFLTPEDAARAYNEAAIKYHGEFAYQNELPD